MPLASARFDQRSGALVVSGRIFIGSDEKADSPAIAAHNDLLLSFMPARHSLPPRIVICPATRADQNENGFYNSQFDNPTVIFDNLGASDIALLCNQEGGDGRLLRKEPKCGGISLDTNLAFQHHFYSHPFSEIDLSAKYSADGVNLKMSGLLGRYSARAVRYPQKLEAHRAWDGRRVFVEAFITVEQLTVLGKIAAGPFWHIHVRGGRPQKNDVPERPRDPRKLQDILICEELTWPIFPGSVIVRPRLPLQYSVAQHVLSSSIGEENLYVSEAPETQLLDNGFARFRGPSNCGFAINTVGRTKLEKVFFGQDTMNLDSAGDGLGTVSYLTGYGDEPSDSFRQIKQSFKNLSFHALLSKAGLEIKIDGELNDFDPKLIEEHRQKRHSRLQPCSSFSIRTTMPWAFLLVRGFSFARKADKFYKGA